VTRRVPITGALAAALRFAPAGWKAAWPRVALTTALAAAAVALRLPGWPGAGLAMAALVGLIDLQGRLYAAAFAQAAPRAGTQLALDGRLLAVLLLKAALLAICGLILFILLLATAYGVASAGPGFRAEDVGTWSGAVDVRGRVVVEALAALGVLVMGWLAMRLSLAEAATFADGRVQVLSAWRLTRAIAVPLSAGLLAVNAPIALALWLLAGAAVMLPDVGVVLWLIGLATGLLFTAFLLPLNVGLMTYLHRQTTCPGTE